MRKMRERREVFRWTRPPQTRVCGGPRKFPLGKARCDRSILPEARLTCLRGRPSVYLDQTAGRAHAQGKDGLAAGYLRPRRLRTQAETIQFHLESPDLANLHKQHVP